MRGRPTICGPGGTIPEHHLLLEGTIPEHHLLLLEGYHSRVHKTTCSLYTTWVLGTIPEDKIPEHLIYAYRYKNTYILTLLHRIKNYTAGHNTRIPKHT